MEERWGKSRHGCYHKSNSRSLIETKSIFPQMGNSAISVKVKALTNVKMYVERKILS